MADQTFDPRLESLLRDALAKEAASLQLTVRADQVVERAQGRRNGRPGWRRLLPDQPNAGLLRLSAAVGTVMVLVVTGVLALSTLSQVPPAPAALLPTSPADWSRVEIESPPGTGGIARIAAGPRGLVAVAAPDENGESRVVFSTDGHDWSLAEHSAVGEYVTVVATDSGFLMVDEDGAWHSADGHEWQRIANNWAGDPDVGGAIVVNAVAGGPGYVAVGSDNKVWYSTDGTDWTLAQMPPPPAEFIRPEYPELTVDLLNVAAIGDHLVATGYVYAGNSDTSITEDIVLASSDGKTWSTVLGDIGDRAGPLQLAAGPNGFLVIGGPLDGSGESMVWQSADGETWQAFATNDFNARSSGDSCAARVRMSAVAAAGSGFVAVGTEHECMDGDFPASPPQALIWTSQDGRSWSRLQDSVVFTLPDAQDSPGAAAGSIVAWGSRFVVGGMYGGEPAIWISGSTPSVEPTAVPSTSATLSSSATPSPSPRHSPQSGRATFTSTIHGISIDSPAGWQTRPATEPWTGGPLDFDSPAADVIFDPALGDRVYLVLASQPLGRASDDDWRNEQVGWLCTVGGSAFGSSTVDGASAFVISCGSTQSAALIPSGFDLGPRTDTRGYLIRLVVSSEEPALAETYDRDWHKAVLGTVDLRPEDALDARPSPSPNTSPSPQPSPAEGVSRFTSTIHGISIDYPTGWQSRPATEPWTGGPLNFDAPAANVDVIFDPRLGERVYLILASQPYGGLTAEAWRSRVDAWACPEGGAFGNWTVDGAHAFARECSTHGGVLVFTDARGYLIWRIVSGDERELVGTYDWDWLKPILETVDLRP